jgi:hypothetical protein
MRIRRESIQGTIGDDLRRLAQAGETSFGVVDVTMTIFVLILCNSSSGQQPEIRRVHDPLAGSHELSLIATRNSRCSGCSVPLKRILIMGGQDTGLVFPRLRVVADY